jgi:hypothetical protein
MVAIFSFETLAYSQNTTRRNATEDQHQYSHHRENLISYITLGSTSVPDLKGDYIMPGE